MYTGLSFASFILFIIEIFDINDKVYSLFIVMGVHILGSVFGIYLGRYIKQKKINSIYINLRRKYTDYSYNREAFTENDKSVFENLDDVLKIR